jgi:hypothetical protein
MSAVPVAPQALQDPDVESIEPPSVDHEMKSGRILQQACARCPPDRETGETESSRSFGLFGLSGLSGLLAWSDSTKQPDRPDRLNRPLNSLLLADFLGILL